MFEFMSNSPWLTFFLAVIGLQSLITIIRYIMYYLAVRKHGWSPGGEFRD